MRSLVQLLGVIVAVSTVAAVRAQEWQRLHVGVAVGNPSWSVDFSEAGVPLPEPIVGPKGPAEPGTGRKFVAGFRPVGVVGVEIQYIDFDEGETGAAGGWTVGGGQVGPFYERTSHMKVSVDATVLSAILFVPEASSAFDVYGKVGVADFNESLATSTTTIECIPIVPCMSTVNSDVDRSESAPYVGIGARIRLARAVAVRVEYEAIDRDVGDPTTMLSLGIAWER
jgi:hypothetical protein